MSTTFRSVSRHVRSLLRTTFPSAPVRAFHSPFVALSSTPATSTGYIPSHASGSPLYEKQTDHSPEPTLSHSGTRTYVVSEPDPSHTPYEVPSGAYPTSAPYVNHKPSEGPQYAAPSSSSSSPAHPTTTRAASQNPSGVGESAAVRYAEAPGEMGQRRGSSGGLGLMDSATTKQGEGQLSSRNSPPDGEVAEEFSKKGLNLAWKARK